MQALIHQIDEEAAAFVFHAPTQAGFEVIATVRRGPGMGPLLLRTNAVLVPGQFTELVVPHGCPGRRPPCSACFATATRSGWRWTRAC